MATTEQWLKVLERHINALAGELQFYRANQRAGNLSDTIQFFRVELAAARTARDLFTEHAFVGKSTHAQRIRQLTLVLQHRLPSCQLLKFVERDDPDSLALWMEETEQE